MNNSLFVACRSDKLQNGRWRPIGRLDHEGSIYRFSYTCGAENLDGFFPFPDMPDFKKIYESDELFPLFTNRLLGSSRPEYKAYLTWSGFDSKTPPDPIALLGVTEGRRVTDSLEIFPYPQKNDDGQYINKFFLHSVRHMPDSALKRIEQLEHDDNLGLMLDISNKYDCNAVAVRTCDNHERHLIGYIPRYLASEIRALYEKGKSDAIKLTVEHVNKDAPFQQRVLCKLSAHWPEYFQPYSSDDFKLIASFSTNSEFQCS